MSLTYPTPDFTSIAFPETDSAAAPDFGQWKERFEETARASFESFQKRTMEQIEVAPLYTEEVYDSAPSMRIIGDIFAYTWKRMLSSTA